MVELNEVVELVELVEIDSEKSMKLETSPKVTIYTPCTCPNEVCIGVAVSVKKYPRIFYYSISQKVITLLGRRFITVSGVFITLSGTYYIIGRFYYIIGHELQYRAFITLSVGTRVMKPWRNRVGWATDREKWKGVCPNRHLVQGDVDEKIEKSGNMNIPLPDIFVPIHVDFTKLTARDQTRILHNLLGNVFR